MTVDRASKRKLRWRAWALAAIALLVVPGLVRESPSLIGASQAQDGLLDLNFGRPGAFTSAGPKGSAVLAIRALPDGKILAAGKAVEDGIDTRATLARYTADGVLDVTFGERGLVTTRFGGRAESAQAFDIQRDGKIVVLGSSLRDGTIGAHHLTLARYHADGALDAAFGQGGTLTTNIPGVDVFGAAVRVQPDGRLLVVGVAVTSYAPAADGRQFLVARYNANGSLDATIGSGGLLRTFPHGSYAWPGGDGIAIQADGKIVAATIGSGTPGVPGNRLRVLRLDADGVPDRTFNHGAPTAIGIPPAMAVLSGLAMQPDGKILVSTVAAPDVEGAPDRADVRLTRINADGTLDEPFAHERGFLVVDVAIEGRNRAVAMAVQADGKILVALSAHLPEPSLPVSVLQRYMPDGRVDFAFGTHGIVVTSHTDPSRQPYASKPHAMALQPDGKILLGGESIPPGAPLGATFDFSLLRFENRTGQ